MEIDQNLLRKHIEALSNHDLMRMLSDDLSQYRPEALAIAKEEFSKRGLSLEFEAAEPADNEESSSSGFMESIRTATKAAPGPASYRLAGEKFVCPNCRNDQFESQTVLLNTRGLTFFKLDWLNADATILTCSNCSLIQWFKTPPERE